MGGYAPHQKRYPWYWVFLFSPKKVPVVLAVFEFSPKFIAKLLHMHPVPFPKPLCVWGGGGGGVGSSKWVVNVVFVGCWGGC